jgi:hypothetical protein
VDRWGAICFALSSTGLFLMALSFAMPWHADPSNPGTSDVIKGVGEAGLVAGVFLWWVFVVTSVLRPSKIRGAIGWLSVSLVLLSLAYTVAYYRIRAGWAVGALATILMIVAAASDLKRSFILEKRKAAGGPFEGDESAGA